MIRRVLNIVLIFLWPIAGLALPAAADVSPGEIPPELARWRSWVLHDKQDALCPSAYNDGAVVRCQWPSQLKFDAAADGGRFEQRWVMFARGWVSLPGNQQMWPDSVVVDGRSVAVVNRNNHPSVRLTPGEHQIEGRFYWLQMPELIWVPPSVGLISLTVGGRKIDSPLVDDKGRLWLQGRQGQAGQEDRFRVRIFRLINDTIPMQITTLLRLDVSGQARQIHLNNVMVDNVVPMELAGRLPARLSAEGQLMIQARPGRWEVRLVGRLPAPVSKIQMGASSHGDEVWSFQPQHHLRMVEIKGVPPVEPGQTEMPAEWRQYAAYWVKPDTTIRFQEIRRGDPDPVPDQLNLHRRWWLDFDGKGITVHDTINGSISRQWYLAVNSPLVLGRVAIEGKDQVITAQGVGAKAGVELRRGKLNLESDARIPQRSGAVGAVGWDHDFKKVSGELYLPPGWRLMAAMGVDEVSHTWLQSWSLLDFFLVLMIALAVFKLRGWRWAVLALATMVLLFHEPGAPRLVWLHILGALALLPLLADNWIKRAVTVWGAGAVIFLLMIAIAFSVNQVRWGLYPQLALNKGDLEIVRLRHQANQARPEALLEKTSAQLAETMPLAKTLSKPIPSAPMAGDQVERTEKAVWHQDPDASIPTGPGLPEWHWQTVRLNWNGPVDKDQGMRLFLFSPWINLALAALRVLLLALFIWGVIDWKPWWRKLENQLRPGATSMVVLLMLIAALAAPVHAAGEAGFPPLEMLKTLKQRLLEPADCLPFCADISRLEMAVAGDELRVLLKVHAAAQTAVPLPANRKSWTPHQILLDNAPISGLARDKHGGLWAVVPAGMHTVIMLASVAEEAMVQIPLPLKPHMASCSAQGWSVKGIQPDGTVGSSIQLTRIQGSRSNPAGMGDNGILAPFLRVRRELHLGLTWNVHTTIERVTPAGRPIVINLPLLAGESPTTAGLHVDKGHVLINMSAQQGRVDFASTLEVTPSIALTAPRAVAWTEIWVLDASPVWHCDLEGIAVVHHQDRGGQWQPQWHPWPGERVNIKVHRPSAIAGQVLTIQKADLTITPGRRFSRSELALKLNTSRGGRHTVEMPSKTNLQQVRVNGKSLPIRQDGQRVTVPLQPGLQTIDIQWHQLVPFQTWYRAPLVTIGKAAANANVTIKMPQKRWILLVGGPRWGPAVLFWSFLTVIVLAAVGLGRLSITTLKTWQWVLLGLGLTQIPIPMALIIIGWLLALGLRDRRSMPDNWLGFNGFDLIHSCGSITT